jgi:hypothetical protein
VDDAAHLLATGNRHCFLLTICIRTISQAH